MFKSKYVSSAIGLLVSLNCFASLSNFKATNDSTNVIYSYTISDAPTFMRVFLDTDQSVSTGYPFAGIGANFLLENENLYAYTGSNGAWSWQLIKSISYVKDNLSVRFVVARADLKSPKGINVVGQYANPVSTSGIVNQIITEPAPAKVAISMAQVSPELGFAYMVNIDSSILGDTATAPTQSKLQLYENGVALGPAHSTHDSIRTLGKGRFSHWGTALRFSSSDNSNPKTNNRAYTYAVLAAPAPAPVTPTPVTTTEVTYPLSSAAIANPDRGFYWMTDCRANPVSVSQLQAYRARNGHSVIHCLWYLRDFKNSLISSAVLNQLATQMDNVRIAGFKMILRFVYTSADIKDAPLTIIQQHLDQIKPILAKNNGDIISVVQTGLIGQWGEMSTSSNFGAPSTAANWSARKAVIDKLLSVVPVNRQVAVRTPAFKMNPYGSTPLTDAEAFTGTARARVTHYNDCFISSSNDYYTYVSAADKPFIQQDSKYLAMSGETCADNAYNECSAAIKEMASLHWSYLHEGYHADVIEKWRNTGCLETIRQRLGYRFSLQSASLPSSAKAGGTLAVKFVINNSGFAAAANSRKVEIILRNTATGALIKLPMSADPRRWLPGSLITVSENVVLPSSIPVGNYALLLNLPDSAPSLYARPEYSIQLANQNVWEPLTGYNSLKATLVVGQ